MLSVVAVPTVSLLWSAVTVAPEIAVIPFDWVTLPEIVPPFARAWLSVAPVAGTVTADCRTEPKPDAENFTSYSPVPKLETE